MVRLLLPAILLSAAFGTVQAAGWIVEGSVVGVYDGDTITVLDDAKAQHRIRFAGIDAPEKGQASDHSGEGAMTETIQPVELWCYHTRRLLDALLADALGPAERTAPDEPKRVAAYA
jgi:hypothetical protein